MVSQQKKKVAIIGAGIVGVSTAVWLQRSGHDVVLIDKNGVAEGTSYGNGGVLASCAIVPVTGPGLLAKAPFMLFDRDQPLFLKWGYLPKLLPWLVKYLKHNNEADTRRIAAALYPIIGDSLEDHQALAAGTAAKKYIAPKDYVYVYRRKADFDKEKLSWSIRREYGFEWEEIGVERLQSMAPGISSDFEFGIRLPNHGIITDPGAYVKSLANHVLGNGGEFIQSSASDFIFGGDNLKGVVSGQGVIACDAGVVAAGGWSGPLMKKLGLKVPLESERGYHIEYFNSSVRPAAPMMLAPGKFVVTPMDGRIRCAGVLEFGGLDAPPSEAPFELLESHMKKAFPGFNFERQERWMGHRPAPSDSIPFVGEISGRKNVFAGFGHHHVGLTGGPKTGRILSQMIDGNIPNLDMEVYSPNRH